MLAKLFRLSTLSRYFTPSYITGIGEMDRSRSLGLLGLTAGCDIASRYRILSKLNHPDLGGSPYISSKINEAKAFLEADSMPL